MLVKALKNFSIFGFKAKALNGVSVAHFARNVKKAPIKQDGKVIVTRIVYLLEK